MPIYEYESIPGRVVCLILPSARLFRADRAKGKESCRFFGRHTHGYVVANLTKIGREALTRKRLA